MKKLKLISTMVFVILVIVSAAPQLHGASDPAQNEISIVRAYFPSLEMARKAVISFEAEVLESEYETGYLVMQVTQNQIDALTDLGFRIEVQAERTLAPMSIPNYPCYETVEETFAEAEGMVSDYPNLAEWIDAGDSWEKSVGQGGYDMKVLILTNQSIAGEKPKLFFTCAIHAREYTTAPLCLYFAHYLVDNYGTDADATWILDHHEVHMMLHTNPDGRKKAEAGYSWRKNTNQNYCGATSSRRGADLNRNFPYNWACCGGSSGNPCDETYRGPSAASEPETQAVVNYVRSIFPDQRGSGSTAAAPDDATGLYIDFHSHGRLVLWPWGYTSSVAPNGTQMQTLGRKFAYWNHHTPEQAIGLYPTDGTTDDFVYGDLGVASYCFELGTSFFQSCSYYEGTIVPDNLPTLIYAAKVPRTPYMTPKGPDAYSLSLSQDDVPAGTNVTLSATVDDTRYNNSNGTESTQNIAAAEYYIDTPPWEGGAVAHAMSASDGGFNEKTEGVQATVNTSGLSQGKHIIFVRGRDTSNNWGAFSAIFLTISGGTVIPAPSNLTATAVPPSRIDMGWQDNSTDEDGFEIQRNVDAGSFVTIATVGANVTEYSDAGLAPGTYCYRAWATKGSDTSGWSNEACATLYDGNIVFEDDFETDKGWSDAGGSATTGRWERCIPQETSYSGVIYQIGGNGDTAMVTGCSAGSGVGSYDIDGGDTLVRSPDIALPNSAEITLSFDYYLSHYSNASSDDYLRFKVVGSATQTVLEVLGEGAVQGAQWQSAEVSLSAFAGQTVYLLVEAADGGSGSLVEAAFDDVLITGGDPVDPPLAPSNLQATAVSESQIDLTWQDNSDNEDSFEIQRKTGTGSFVTVATVGANVTGYSDTGLASETTYTYQVRAANTGGTSDWSNQDAATTLPEEPPLAPSNLAAAATSSSQIDLTWQDNSNDEDGFEIQRKTGTGSFATVATVGANEEGYSDTGLAPDTTYTYQVKAVKGSLSSTWSNLASDTTLSGPVFEDDFSTDKGWTSAGGTATTGQWERNIPQSTSYSGVAYQLDAASPSYDLVTGASAGSGVGSYDIDGGDTRFRSPNIDLPDQSGLTLSFQYYLAHYSNATSADYLRVKVVGDTTETVLEVLGTGSVKGGAWQTATVNLDAFAGQQIYLLIEAADAGSASLVEAAIDDVLIE